MVTNSLIRRVHRDQLPDRDQQDQIPVEGEQHSGPRELLPPHIVDFLRKGECVVIENEGLNKGRMV